MKLKEVYNKTAIAELYYKQTEPERYAGWKDPREGSRKQWNQDRNIDYKVVKRIIKEQAKEPFV